MSSDAMIQVANNGWTIKEWNRSLGRGVITSRQLGDVAFDGGAATVSDFVTGELVHIVLNRIGNEYRVSSIWPDDPRFIPKSSSDLDPPPLQSGMLERLEANLSRMPVALDYRLSKLVTDLVVDGDHDNFCYGAELELRFHGVQCIELPMSWGGKSFRLANAIERSYLASRCELTNTTVAMRIVDIENRIFFAVCGDFEWKQARPV
jgi:hypothetical protein